MLLGKRRLLLSMASLAPVACGGGPDSASIDPNQPHNE